MALTSVWMLAGCAGSTPSGRATINLPALPAAVTQCDRAILMPETDLSRGQVEQLWARDRAALAKCGLNLKALVAFYEDLSRRLAAAKQ